ncbi:contact-dependent growth inhibition system immunity protein [Kitasatospora sp. NPDC051853]|uniref:contact-dependent growth inhibition system immunity protein n=1 Tax=Kitasatospora sp. NPDC051853 TaxID=3364058 RepID=UPI00378A47B1
MGALSEGAGREGSGYPEVVYFATSSFHQDLPRDGWPGSAVDEYLEREVTETFQGLRADLDRLERERVGEEELGALWRRNGTVMFDPPAVGTSYREWFAALRARVEGA